MMMMTFPNFPRRRRSAGVATASTTDDGAAAASASTERRPLAPKCRKPAPSSSRRDEEVRAVKGKEMMDVESPPRRRADNNNKLTMGGAIRCHTNAAASSGDKTPSPTTSRKRKADDRASAFWFGTGRDARSTSSAGSDLTPTIGAVASARLLATLRTLGAPAPTRAYGKLLPRSDRRTQQSRLLMSAKAFHATAFPLDAFLTAPERVAARAEAGLEVLALDRAGEAYPGMRLKFLLSNAGYRVIGRWGAFLRRNGLVLPPRGPLVNDVMLDLWAFRASRAGAGGSRLGLVFMHYRKGDAAFGEQQAARATCGRRRTAPEHSASATQEEEDVSGDEDGVVIPDLNDDDVAMEDDAAGYRDDAATDGETSNNGAGGQGDEVTAALPPPTSSDAITGATTAAAEETGGAKQDESVAVTLATAPVADRAVAKDDAGGAHQQGNKAASPPSFSNAGRPEAVEVITAPVSAAAGAEEEGTAARGRAAELASLLSSCKPDVLHAARTLMQMYQSSW